jgi:RNA polymerase-binding transcription factor DksA
MEANLEKLYTELRISNEELLKRLNNQEGSAAVKTLIKEEMNDIQTAMEKIITGNYGRCEISGELIPEEVLEAMPTIKTLEDIDSIHNYFRKPFHYH